MAVVPRVLKNFSMFVDGRGYAGKIAELNVPKLARKMEEFRGGGMGGPIEMEMGLEKLECDFTLKEYSEEVLRLWGVVDHAGVSVRFKGALQADDPTGTVTPIEITVRGRWREIDGGSWKAGEAATLKAAIAVSYYKYVSGDNTLIEIDMVNMVEKIGDTDRLAEIRAAIGG